MNAAASRVVRNLSRNRCLTSTSTRSVATSSSWMSNERRGAIETLQDSFSAPLSVASPSTALSSIKEFQIQQNKRFFGTSSGGDGNEDESNEESSSAAPVIPPVVDLDSNSNANAEYDPYEITKTFEDTSYYFPPTEETDPQFLASKYEGMTNEELLDSSTIPAVKDPHTGATHTWESLMHSPPIRDKNATLPKGTLVGTVVSTKMQKTVNVAVDRYKVHPKYRKRIRYTRKFMAHDEHEVASDGDLVLIVPSQRISKKKHFVLREILKAKGQL